MTRLAASVSRGSLPVCPGRQLNDRLVLPMWIPTEPFWNAMIGVAVLPAVIPPAPALISRADGPIGGAFRRLGQLAHPARRDRAADPASGPEDADGPRGGARSGAQMGCLTDLRGT